MTDGYRRIELPLPFALGSLNVYLVASGGDYILIDCGMETDASEAALEAGFHDAGVRLEQISTIVLTHIHPDHAGFAGKLKRKTGAKILIHGEERRLLAEVITGARSRWQDDALRAAGTPEDMVAKVRASFGALKRALNRLELSDVEVIGTRVGHLEVIWTPGHSRGHVCLFEPFAGRLFSGDQMLAKGPPNIGWEDDHDALDAFFQSLDCLDALAVEHVLPAHGEPFSRHREWISRARRHHERRLRHIEEIICAKPCTAHEITTQIWPAAVTPLDYRFGLFEVLAHLIYLERRNRVINVDGSWRLVAPNDAVTIQ